MVVHFSIGLLITVAILKKTKSQRAAFFTVLILACLKEVFDSFSLTATYQEAIKDIAVTMIFPTLTLITSTVKAKLDSMA